MSSTYKELFKSFSANGGGEGPVWLPVLRKEAFGRFAELGFPTTKNEDWHFTSVAPIADRTFAPATKRGSATKEQVAALPGGSEDWHRLVFVNGQLESALSSFAEVPADVTISTLSSAIDEGLEIVKESLGKLADHDTQSFTALNTAFWRDGVFIHIPKGVIIEKPIHIVHIVDSAADGCAINPRFILVAEPLSSAVVVEQFVGDESASYLTNYVAEVRVGDGAKIEHYRVQSESHKAFHVEMVQADQDRNSTYHSFVYATGAALSRINVYSRLSGDGAITLLNGLYTIDGKQHSDHQTFVEHIAPNCSSREIYKGILDEESHGVFNGKVYVAPEAQKTDGKQTNQTLLLSDKARVDTKPQLEIFADDVKCTHGATVGRLDEHSLFYLKSRGINDNTARALLTYAFAAEVLETIEIPELRDALEAQLFERFTHLPKD